IFIKKYRKYKKMFNYTALLLGIIVFILIFNFIIMEIK
ncbi:glycosyltransferase family 2 protein, partial [Campylobacter jejuni]|nr:glycosyltransferase family 2 protein [Campylobacter jejuni]ECR4145667.1 glycosyltransferase family 2 protein [Campylobacter jejuni]